VPSLYERLGGVYAIAAVVDDFIDRVMDDPRLIRFWRDQGGRTPGAQRERPRMTSPGACA
jgi:truncated hemoglobin YjbI